jgi:hypothetical protein
MRLGHWYRGAAYIPTGLLLSVGQQQRWQNVMTTRKVTWMKADVPPRQLIPPRLRSLWCMWSVRSSPESAIVNVIETWTVICDTDHKLDLYGQHSWKYIHTVLDCLNYINQQNILMKCTVTHLLKYYSLILNSMMPVSVRTIWHFICKNWCKKYPSQDLLL